MRVAETLLCADAHRNSATGLFSFDTKTSQTSQTAFWLVNMCKWVGQSEVLGVVTAEMPQKRRSLSAKTCHQRNISMHLRSATDRETDCRLVSTYW